MVHTRGASGMIINTFVLMSAHQDRLGNIMAYGSSNLPSKSSWIHFRELGQGHTIVAKHHLASDWLVMMFTFAETLVQAMFQVIGSGQHLHALSQEITRVLQMSNMAQIKATWKRFVQDLLHFRHVLQ